MSKATLINTLASSRLACSKSFAEDAINVMGEAIASELRSSGEATVPGIGKLKLVKRAARTARNPRTGETVKVKAGKRVKFVVAKALKEAVA